MGSYAGDINATDAWGVLSSENDSFLVDVRTDVEWNNAGVPDLSKLGKELVKIQWVKYPNFDLNQDFTAEIQSKVANKDAKLLFLCKVGGRSAAAAETLTSLGYKNCFNVVGGMEEGWKPNNLPWRLA
jgi:rhodanese-related sulfurtransferase